MRPAALFALLLALAPATSAQNAVDEPMATVTELFEAMLASDSTRLAATLHPQARLMTTAIQPDGTPVVITTPFAAFKTSVADAPAGSLNEKLYDVELRVDGTMAMAWTPYRFYYNGAFSHCGTNQFTLVRTADGWKILQILDTRRRDDCAME